MQPNEKAKIRPHLHESGPNQWHQSKAFGGLEGGNTHHVFVRVHGGMHIRIHVGIHPIRTTHARGLPHAYAYTMRTPCVPCHAPMVPGTHRRQNGFLPCFWVGHGKRPCDDLDFICDLVISTFQLVLSSFAMCIGVKKGVWASFEIR